MKSLVALFLACLGLLMPAMVEAQASGGSLANLVADLVLRGIVLPGGANPGTPHGAHFTLAGQPDPTQALSRPDEASVRAVAQFSERFRAQFAVFPLGSSTGGFTFSFDERAGIYTRNTDSFGPAFGERAMTIGRRRFSVGVNYQHTGFDTFAGENLRDGSIKFYLPHTDCCSAGAPPPSENNPGMEGDILQADLLIDATIDTVALFANYGVNDRIDVGAVIPLSRVDVTADLHAHIIRLSSADNSRVHTFVQGEDVSEKTFRSSGSAVGLGDILLRTKYNFLRSGDIGIAAAMDLRVPTGNEDDLLGIGTTQAKLFAIVSSIRGRLATHANAGVTLSGHGSRELLYDVEPLGVSDEINYYGAVELAAHPRLTLLGEIVGRTLLDAGDIDLQDRTFRYRVGSTVGADAPELTSTINPLTEQPYRQLALQPDHHLSILLGAAGFKFNAATNLLVAGHVLFPINNAGLRDRVTVALGIDYAF